MKVVPAGFVALCFLVVVGMTFAQEGEEKVKRSDLPVAVQKSMDAESKGATVRGISREVDNGKTFYEAELTVNGHIKDILVDANGKIVEVEEEVSLDSLAAAVQRSLQKKAGSGKIVKVESLTKGGKLVAYEAQVKMGARTREVQVGPNGETLAHEE